MNPQAPHSQFIIGFVIKRRVSAAAAFAVELGKFLLEQRECDGLLFATESQKVAEALGKALPPGAAKAERRVRVVEKEKLVERADLIIVLGGDGTYLSIARLMKKRSVPVMGVNMGQLGFLTEIKQSEAFDVVRGILAAGKPIRPEMMSERSLLEVTLLRETGKASPRATAKQEVVYQGPVVNDAVISKGAIARIIGLDILINGKLASPVRADGLIVSTPTGSTAYSLAAGGPILEPSLRAMTLTPICPHALTQRPLVVPDTAEITIRLKHRPGRVLLTLDGQEVIDLKQEDTVVVKKFLKHPLRLVTSPSRDYYSVLREKLKFGMRD